MTGGKTDEALARMCIRASQHAPGFLESCGVVFQPSLSGTLSLSRTNAFFLGGGKALVNALYRTAERLGVVILYDTEVQHIEVQDGFATEAIVSHRGFPARLRFKAFVASAGGFQANREWLRKYWGDAADNFQIRGTPYAQGRILKDMLASGRAGGGRPHAVPRRRERRPRADGGWRPRHAARLRALRDRGEPRRRALLRRGRGCLAEALRHLGPADRAAAGPGRLRRSTTARRS